MKILTHSDGESLVKVLVPTNEFDDIINTANYLEVNLLVVRMITDTGGAIAIRPDHPDWHSKDSPVVNHPQYGRLKMLASW
jgi:hypothetical protein